MSKQRGIYEKIVGSGVWWIRYADRDGKIRRERVGSKSAAIKLRDIRKAATHEGKKLPIDLRAVTRVEDITPYLLRDYRLNKRKSVEDVERRLRKHILPFFGKMNATNLRATDVDRYIDRRKGAKASNATINREMAALKRVFSLARKADEKLQEMPMPKFPHLKENAPRSGFVEAKQYRTLLGFAEELWLKAIIATGYTFGFRRNELLGLRVHNIDPLGRRIYLDVGSTKNGEGRAVVMTQEVWTLISGCIHAKQPDDFVFTRSGNQPVIDFRGTWYALCERAGLGRFAKGPDNRGHWTGLLFHDLRRSAVRNMVRSGISDRVAMKISGHISRSVFDRYNITSEADLEAAAMKLERARSTDTTTDTGQNAPNHPTEIAEGKVQSLQ